MLKKYFHQSSNSGKLILLIGCLLLTPLVVLPFFPNDTKFAFSFLAPSLFSITLGLVFCRTIKINPLAHWQHSLQSSHLTVLLTWGYGCFIGAIPFLLSGKLSFVQALFESISGWTTTGLSVVDVENTPNIFLFYRSFMQFCGGLGFVLVLVTFMQGKQAMNLYNAEGHYDKLMPNLKKTTRLILQMYLTFLVLGTVLYSLFGMPMFESLLHSMSALSTGGFSTRADSIGAYHSLEIEIITILLMIIGTTNFAVLLLLTKRKWKQLLRVSELRFFSVVLVIFTPLLAISLFCTLYTNVSESMRIAVFNIISALSTTGYSTTTYTEFPPFAIGILLLLMLIGGGFGSTAGGLKLTRVYLLLRITAENIYKRCRPNHLVTSPFYYKAQGKTPIDQQLTNDTIGFVSSYLILMIIGTLLLTLTSNSTLTKAAFEFASTLGTVGLSIGLTDNTTNEGSLIIQMFGMILGRLEIFIVLIGIYSGIARIKEKRRRAG
ncbi:trk system potassium uptake protein TrkH [Pilibacter termitis]|uniref:Trk system potassium uptake protein TrkH n=1 Tax=Pilibacter termitis TaxID=263852 RepID=A0A1T4M656_9ENTE|nr:potassium transporter TrkG [Pilibacter termitis]SJZ62381.1 trk system potassium uptake protein TrkH [Pilibacter termitis]